MKRGLFGTAGIRGITNQTITPQLALKFAQAYGSYFQGRIAVARDPRYGAEMLEQAILAGLVSTGCEGQELGVVPLPIFARWVADFAEGGIMVTGSHIPPNQIGIVPVDGLGRDLCQRDEKGIEEIYLRTESKLVEWDKIKNLTKVNSLENYIKFLEKETENVSGFKVGLDLANGCFSSTARNILEELGIKAFCINDKLKPVPSRPSEPRKETLKELSKLTKGRLDLGAGTDVDGDRVVFLDSQGNGVSEDIIGAIFAKELVKANEWVVTPINSSLLIEKVAKECGFKVSYCKVGPPAIAESILKTKATYAYEESGKYLFPPKTLWGDALLSTLKLLEILDKNGNSLAELVAEFPQRIQIKEKIPIKQRIKQKVTNEVKKLIKFDPPEGIKGLVTLDGVKLIFEEGWLLIRASGTEDILRVYSDGKNKAIAEKLIRLGERIVKEGIKQIAK